MLRIRKYLNDKFETTKISLKPTNSSDGSVEFLYDGEFMGVIYRDEDEGEVSYNLNLAILEIDLPGASDAALI